jgi:hypothetical protein
MQQARHIFIQQWIHVSAEVKFLTKPLGPNMHMMSNLTINTLVALASDSCPIQIMVNQNF